MVLDNSKPPEGGAMSHLSQSPSDWVSRTPNAVRPILVFRGSPPFRPFRLPASTRLAFLGIVLGVAACAPHLPRTSSVVVTD